MKKIIIGESKKIIAVLIAIIFIGIAATTVTLTTFDTYLEVIIDGESVGYYKTEDEYLEVLKSCLSEEYENEVKVTKFSPTHSPEFRKVFVKKGFIEQVNNYDLVNRKLTKEYTIYKIVENDVTKTYALTTEQAQLAVLDIRNNANKSTAITIEPIQVTDLSLILDESAVGGDIDLYDLSNLANCKVTQAEIDKALKNDEYIWPSDSTRITSTYGYRTLFGYTALHKGLDIGCATGSNVYAMKEGKVILAEYSNSYGWYVKVDHGNGVITLYAHNSELLVNVGDYVKQGEVIAKSGSTGNSTGPHLHVEFIVNGVAINPQKFI